MIKSLVIGFVSAIVIVITSTYFYLKAYKEPSIYYDTLPAYHIVYKENRGVYVQTSQTIISIEETLKKQSLICESTFGLFFDDPDVVVEQDLKSWAGCIFKDKPNINSLPEDVKLLTIQTQTDVLSADFDGSPALGPIKVYPKAKKMLGSNSLFPALEIYSYQKDNSLKTKYYFSIEQFTFGKSAE